MSLILSGSDGVSDIDGSASTPAIRGTDANTGIFFPAADTIAFAEGGAESMRIDSSGNLGLGVTPSAWGSTYRMQQIGLTASVGGRTAASQAYLSANWYQDGTNNRYITTAPATQYQQDGGVHYWFNAASGTAGNTISFTQAMTLDASGRLLVGTTSSGVYGGNTVEFRGANIATLGSNVTGNLTLFTTNSQAANVGAVLAMGGIYDGTTPYAFGAIAARKSNSTNGNAEGYLQFYTTNSGNSIVERARITSDGNFCLNTTATGLQTARSMSFLTTGGSIQYISHSTADASGDSYVEFGYNGTKIGSITQNGTTAVAYNTSSDYRLKENIAPMTGALATVSALKPCTYTWKADGSVGQGFIAHELQAVVPDAVTGVKDETEIQQYEVTSAVYEDVVIPAVLDEDGNEVEPERTEKQLISEAVMGEREVPKYQGVDTSFLVATLTAAIQELKAELDTANTRLAALENK